jgi:hypothetical protein
MKRLARYALIPAVLVFSSCGSSTKAAVTSVPAVAVTVAATPATTVSVAPAAPATTAAMAETSVVPVTSAAAATTPLTVPPLDPSLVTISVTVGKDSSPTREEKVKLGSTVQISLLNPTANDEFHLHGFDIEQAQKAGEQGLLSFVADKAGRFELESHVTNAPLLMLVVA